MSGHKVAKIKIGQAEYARLREAEENLRLQNLQAGIGQSILSDRSERWGTIQRNEMERSLSYQSILKDLNEDIRSIEIRANKQIASQDKQIEFQLRNANDQIHAAIGHQVDSYLAEANSQISAQLKQLDQLQNAILTNESEQRFKTRSVYDQAVNYFDSSMALLEHILQQYPNTEFFESEVDQARRNIQELRDLIAGGDYELARLNGYQTYRHISQFRHILEQNLSVTTELRKTALIQAVQQLEMALQGQFVPAMDLDGGLLDDQVDVDFWTKGKHSILIENLNRTINWLSDSAYLPLEPIRNLLENVLPKFEQESMDLVTEARMEALTSQLRFNLAQVVVQALESQGFHLQQSSYQQDDFRSSYVAVTRNRSGNEVVVMIDPTNQLDQGGRLQILSTDASEITEHELHQRNHEISQAINQAGIPVGELKKIETNLTRRKQEIQDMNHQSFLNGSDGISHPSMRNETRNQRHGR